MTDATGKMMTGDTLVPGSACARPFVLDKPLSFWGGYDSGAGKIVDRGHPQAGASLAGKVMVMPHAKGRVRAAACSRKPCATARGRSRSC